MKYVILGCKGFVGKKLYKHLLSQNLNVIGLDRNFIDFTKTFTYSNFNFNNYIIIDCISNTSTNKDCFKTNIEGLKNFLTYLNKHHFNFTYIYLSTYSTQLKQHHNNNYVVSKLLAEEFIIKNIKNYKIIRLIFPFGVDENPNRLISRTIANINNNEHLILHNLFLNLTPIEYVVKNIFKLTKTNTREINLCDGKLYKLIDIVNYIYEILNKKPNYTLHPERKFLCIDPNKEVSNIDNLKKSIIKIKNQLI